MSRTEYAVKWGSDGNDIEEVPDRARAEALINLYPAWDGQLVSRVVTYSDWLAIARGAEL